MQTAQCVPLRCARNRSGDHDDLVRRILVSLELAAGAAALELYKHTEGCHARDSSERAPFDHAKRKVGHVCMVVLFQITTALFHRGFSENRASGNRQIWEGSRPLTNQPLTGDLPCPSAHEGKQTLRLCAISLSFESAAGQYDKDR